MSITADAQAELINEYARKEGDTGSPEVQVAILSRAHPANSTEHLATTTRISIPAAACWSWSASAARLLDYLKRVDAKRYETLIERLGLRR